MRTVPSLLAVLLVAALADAHPLGNFTINRYAALRVERQTLGVQYVVDMAELPALGAMRSADADGDGTMAADERDAYLGVVARELGHGLEVALDGAELPLVPGPRSLEVSPGAGRLPTLRLDLAYSGTLPAGRGQIEFRDQNFPGRAGWQEVIAVPGDGTAFAEATVPPVDRSQALRVYPDDLLEAPLEVSTARLTYGPGSAPVTGHPADPPGRQGAARFGDRLTQLIATDRPLGVGLVLASLLTAAGLGALHALGPGHGKTIVGAYLVGARGTGRHALLLGLVVTATHTAAVYLLGLATLVASEWVVPERLFPWLGMVSGLLVLGIGASLVSSRLQLAHHDHPHGHGHDHPPHDHGHPHLPDDPLSMRSLVALGVSGGLLPCPSALVVMLGAIALGRVAFGLGLIVAFSVGLAAVLSGIGLALVYFRDQFERLPIDGRVARVVPVVSALVISAAGIALVAQALAQIGA